MALGCWTRGRRRYCMAKKATSPVAATTPASDRSAESTPARPTWRDGSKETMWGVLSMSQEVTVFMSQFDDSPVKVVPTART